MSRGERLQKMKLENIENSNGELLTISEVCNLLKISRMQVFRLRKAGKLAVIQNGRFIRFRRSSVLTYLSKLEIPAFHKDFAEVSK